MDFLSITFLFSINRVQIEPVDKIFLFIGVAALVLALILKLGAYFAPSPVDAKFRNKFFNLFLFLSLAELVWYGARAQLVRFFGTHFTAIFIVAISLVWLAWVLWKLFRNYRGEKTAWAKEQVRLKYLPK